MADVLLEAFPAPLQPPQEQQKENNNNDNNNNNTNNNNNNTTTTNNNNNNNAKFSFSVLRPHLGVITSSLFCALLIGFNDGALGANLPRLGKYYNLPTSTISTIFLLQTLGFLASAFSNGFIVNRLRQEGALLVGGSLYFISFVLISIPLPFPAMACVMFILGLGVGLEDAGLNTVIAELPLSPFVITIILNMFHAFWGIGSLIGPLVATGLLAHNIQWNITYVIWASVAAVNIAGFLSAFWPRLRLSRKTPRSSSSGSKMMRSTLSLRTVWLGAIFLLFYVGVETTIGSWIYTFLTEYRHGDPVFMGTITSIYWIGLTSGRLFLGFVTSYLGEKRMIAFYCVCSILTIIGAWQFTAIVPEAILLFLVGVSIGPLFPTTIAVISRLVPTRLLPTSIGFLASFGNMGSALFPLVTGVLAQKYGIQSMMPFAVAISSAMFSCWLVLWRYPSVVELDEEVEVNDKPQEVEHVEKQEDIEV